MSLENGILGFLSMKPMTGYDLKKLFNMSASYFWPADQSQIYRSIKNLTKDGLIELKECKKGETVERKIFAITEKGQAEYLKTASENSVSDFISRDTFLLQLFFSGALCKEEQLQFLDKQIANVNALTQKLIDNYDKNISKFINSTGLDKKDRRLHSAVSAHRWGLIKCREYAKLLEEIKTEIQ